MDQDVHKLRDLGEATVLLVMGFELLGFEPTDREGVRMFVFSKYPTRQPVWDTMGGSQDAEAVVKQYRSLQSGGLMVNAYDFFMAGKELKNRLFDNLQKR